jgi:hypothetical protein
VVWHVTPCRLVVSEESVALHLHQQAVRTSDVALRLDLYRNDMSVFLENDFQIAF